MKKLPLLALALALAGCAAPSSAPKEVVLEVTDEGFVPAVAEVPKGGGYTLVVTRRTDKTCATEIVMPALGTTTNLPLGETVRIAIPAGAPDTLDYACAMDMIKGRLVAK